MENEHGEEGNAEPSMDEGRGAHVEGVCAREDKDGDRAKTYAERGCDVWSGVKVGRGAGRRSEEEGVSSGGIPFSETERQPWNGQQRGRCWRDRGRKETW
jgi:hypothetical protein